MAKNLKKFVNPKFVRTVPLGPMRRLLERHGEELTSFDFSVFDDEPACSRRAIHEFFVGPEDQYPQGLVADLHRISDVGTQQGLDILIQQARRLGVTLVRDPGRDLAREDPKHVALTAFLDQRAIFDAAADILASRLTSSLSEFVGRQLGIEPQLDEASTTACARAVGAMLKAELHGDHCQVGWHEDAGETCLVVTHGAAIKTTPVLSRGREDVICFRPMAQSRLRYAAAEARLKVGGRSEGRRRAIAEVFAAAILGRPGFFSGPSAQDLYTLSAIERDWPQVRLCWAHDPLIRRVRVAEVRLDRGTRDLLDDVFDLDWSLVVTQRAGCALTRLQEIKPDLNFRSGGWRLGRLVLSVDIQADRPKPVSVTVAIQPKGLAQFRRHRFEAQIMGLLQRNGFCHDRDVDVPALAAE